ncbi:MAG: hypothetical protein ABL953_11270 [Ilumatobacteraceae bacterium]
MTRDDDWQPATSEPGELYTFEGQMRAYGHFARNLKTDDPRARAHRRTIGRTGWVFVGAALAVPAIAILLSILF